MLQRFRTILSNKTKLKATYLLIVGIILFTSKLTAGALRLGVLSIISAQYGCIGNDIIHSFFNIYFNLNISYNMKGVFFVFILTINPL